MKFHFTDIYKVKNTAKKETTKYIYTTSNTLTNDEIPLTDYYDGNWLYKDDGAIISYDNEGFTPYNHLNNVKLKTGYPYSSTSFYLNPHYGDSISYAASKFFDFTYYGNYKVYFIPIPATHFNFRTSTYEQINFYIPVARVVKDNTYSKIHFAEFERIEHSSSDTYLKGAFDISLTEPYHFLKWRRGGVWNGAHEGNFPNYVDLGIYANSLSGVLVPHNNNGDIFTSSKGISESFGITKIKSTLLNNNYLLYYLTNPIYFINYINNVPRKYYMDFRFLPYTNDMDECYGYYQNNLSSITLENLTDYNHQTKLGTINFNNKNYSVSSYNMLYIGLDTLIEWYMNQLNGTGVNYILINEGYWDWGDMESNRVYPEFNQAHFQAIIAKIKELYDSSEFDIQLNTNGFSSNLGNTDIQANKYTTRTITETTKKTTTNFFINDIGG